MIRKLRCAAARISTLLSVNYAYMLEYRVEIYLWALSNTLPFILMGVWVHAARQGDFPMNPAQMASYFLVVFIVRNYTSVWVVWDFEYHVVEGKLSPLLLQPLDPAWRFVAAHAGEKLARTPFVAAIIALVLLLYPESRWTPTIAHVLLAATAIVAAFVLRFCIQYTSAMLAFHVERASAIEELMFLPLIFLSGLIAPLSLYPEPVRAAAMWTPFPYVLHFPVQLLLGRTEHAVQGFAIIAAWSATFFLLNRLLWRLGLRCYSAMGA